MNHPRVILFLIAVTLSRACVADGCAATCVELPPLKPVHRIWGVVFFPSGDAVVNAKVSVLRNGKEVARQQTDEDGKFSFSNLRPGAYELRAEATAAIPTASTKVVLINPQVKPKQEIAIQLDLQGCSSFALVDPKKFHPDTR